MKIISILILALLLSGCEIDEYSPAYIDFIDEYGTDSHYYCDESTGFLMLRTIQPKDDAPVTLLVTNASKDPVECVSCEQS